MIESVAADLRFAGRMIRRSPLFAVVAVSCISLGSGSVATIFSAMNAMVLRPLAGAAAPEQLVRIERKVRGANDGISASLPYFRAIERRARATSGMIAWGKASLAIRGDGAELGTEVYGSYVSADFFRVLGVRPELGRFFVDDDDRPGSADIPVVVSDGFWRAHLAADPSAIGRALWVNGRRFTLVGVAPAEFEGLDAPIESEAWVPMHARPLLMPGSAPLDDPSNIWLRVAARLRPGVTSVDAARELSALTAAMASEALEPSWMAKYSDVRLSQLTGLPPDASGPLAEFLSVLLAAAVLVLLIASVNVGAMLSARAIARRRELAVRAALGAARGRLVRQLLTEILVLFALGAAGGITLAMIATAALERIPIPAEVRITLRLTPDHRVFAFAIGVSLLTGLVVGLAPALRAARSDVATRLRDGAAAASARRTPIARGLVVLQLALSLLLLIGAGLFVRSLQRGSRIDPGFEPAGVVTAQLNMDNWGYDEAHGRAFARALHDRLATLPGVSSVSYTTILPLTLRSSVDGIRIGRDEGANTPEVQVHQFEIGPEYFATLRLPIVAGRPIDATDDERSSPVAVVNATFARRFWPDGSALGRTFRYGDQRITIVGVARDAKYASLTESWQGAATPPVMYLPLAQQWRPRAVLMVRATAAPGALSSAIQDAVRSIDRGAPALSVMTLTDAMSLGLLPQRVAAMVTGVLGAIGLILAAIGLYGIIAYSAGRRTKEIGIRLALGARAGDVLRMIVGEGVRMAAVGVAIGLALAVALTRLVAGFLVGLSPLDGVTYAGVAVLLVVVALVASWIPARRAAAADLASVLRSD